MKKIFLTTFLFLFLSASNLYAYNRDTHQHITELAYGYLKIAKGCEPLEYSDADACQTACEEKLRNTDLAHGYSCDCLEQACNDCTKEGTTSNGFKKYQCVSKCAATNVGAQQCLKSQSCSSPYFYDADWPDIVKDACYQSCADATKFVAPERCAFLGKPGFFSTSFIDFSKASRAVKYFQNFEASPCPPTSYSYHKVEHCFKKESLEKYSDLRINPNHKKLSEWDEIAGEEYRLTALQIDKKGRRISGFKTNYIPVMGYLYEIYGFVDLLPKPGDEISNKLDYTGSILGFYAGTVDLLDDLHFSFRGVPIIEDALKTVAEIATLGAYGALAAMEVVGGVLACGAVCVVTPWSDLCGECFTEVHRAAAKIMKDGQEVVNSIEETTVVGTHPSTVVLDQNATSMFHFMNEPGLATPFTSIYDDIDGYIPSAAFGVVGNGLGQTLDKMQFDQLIDLRVSYPESRRVLNNYQITNADDHDRDSINRPLFYWTRGGILEYTFPPVDNMAYYWWHKWLNSRLNANEEKTGLLPLGAVFHAVQDITQPYHAWGVTFNGHSPYEDWISDHLDPTLAELNEYGGNPVLKLKEPKEEQKFLALVTENINEIYRKVISPNDGVLHIRKLVHFLYERTVNGNTGLKGTDEDFFKGVVSGGFDYNIEESFIKDTAIPLAVAASVVIMMEASQKKEDLGKYKDQLGLKLSDFEKVGAVPPLSSASEGVGPGAANTAKDRPLWSCASESVIGKKATQDYANNKISGRTLLRLVFAEKKRCEFLQLGMPANDEVLFKTLGRLEADRLESVMLFLSHGDIPRLEKEIACANALASPLVAPENADLFAARCDGTLDSDFDGVVDQLDKCATPKKVLQDGYLVDVDGCAFSHENDPMPHVNSFILGTVKK